MQCRMERGGLLVDTPSRMLVAAFLIEILHVGKHVIELICVDLCVLPVAQQDHRVACHSIPAAAHVCLSNSMD